MDIFSLKWFVFVFISDFFIKLARGLLKLRYRFYGLFEIPYKQGFHSVIT